MVQFASVVSLLLQIVSLFLLGKRFLYQPYNIHIVCLLIHEHIIIHSQSFWPSVGSFQITRRYLQLQLRVFTIICLDHLVPKGHVVPFGQEQHFLNGYHSWHFSQAYSKRFYQHLPLRLPQRTRDGFFEILDKKLILASIDRLNEVLYPQSNIKFIHGSIVLLLKRHVDDQPDCCEYLDVSLMMTDMLLKETIVIRQSFVLSRPRGVKSDHVVDKCWVFRIFSVLVGAILKVLLVKLQRTDNFANFGVVFWGWQKLARPRLFALLIFTVLFLNLVNLCQFVQQFESVQFKYSLDDWIEVLSIAITDVFQFHLVVFSIENRVQHLFGLFVSFHVETKDAVYDGHLPQQCDLLLIFMLKLVSKRRQAKIFLFLQILNLLLTLVQPSLYLVLCSILLISKGLLAFRTHPVLFLQFILAGPADYVLGRADHYRGVV